MSSTPRIYLDNAATSFPKPEGVYAAVDRYNRELGVAVGRGAYRQAVEVQAVVDRCRKRAADLFRAKSPERIIFTFNGTDSLNLALHGLLGPGDHVVTSTVEHNSVRRPLRELQERFGVEVTTVAADATGRVEPTHFRDALRPNTKLIALIHASNVTGVLQPIVEVGEIAREAGVLFLVDAAQSAGHVPIDLNDLPIDLLACPGHKGLLGPLGTGLLYIRPGVEEQLRSVRQGGTGSNSEDDHQPPSLPDKYESGNHNAPGLFGLEASLVYLQERGIEAIARHEQELTTQLLEGLAAIDGVETYPRSVGFNPPEETPTAEPARVGSNPRYGTPAAVNRVGVVSVAVRGYEPQDLAMVLDESFHIQTRAGLHCAPGAHQAIGTFNAGGTVRLSVGPFTTPTEIDATLAALRDIARHTV